jgi:hypothetical protein
MDTKNILKDSVSGLSPDLQRLKKMDSLITDNSDAMSDLNEDEITAFALFQDFNDTIIEIPGTMTLLSKIQSLRRSRDRLGRQEVVKTLKGSPGYVINPYNYEEDQKPGIIQRLKGLFSKRKEA